MQFQSIVSCSSSNIVKYSIWQWLAIAIDLPQVWSVQIRMFVAKMLSGQINICLYVLCSQTLKTLPAQNEVSMI